MSKVIYDDGKMTIMSFFDGVKRGKCIQVTIGDSYVQYTEKEVIEINNLIDIWLSDF